VQPAEPVGPADPDDATVRQVDIPLSGEQRLLLAERVPVVGRDAGIDAVGLDCA
jgi:hypothetical protein